VFFFITGTSGSGKSTLMMLLKLQLLGSQFVVYDFDEVGVPTNADQVWRQQATDYWLIKAYENSMQNISTIFCGVAVLSEVLRSLHKPDLSIYFGFIKVADEVIQDRLQQRGWNEQLIQDNLVWAKFLQNEVEQQKNSIIVDTAIYTTPEQVANESSKFIIGVCTQ
jgi:broad-specificity NMP kinase